MNDFTDLFNLSTREIYLCSNDEDGFDAESAQKFIRGFHCLERNGKEPILVHYYTVGGNVYSGYSLFDILNQSSCPILVLCHGLVASFGVVLMQACCKEPCLRLSMPNCTFLIHNGNTGIGEEYTYKQTLSACEIEKKINDKMILTMANAMHQSGVMAGKPIAKIKRFLTQQLNKHEDWWLTAEEAKHYGLIDGIISSPPYEFFLNFSARGKTEALKELLVAP